MEQITIAFDEFVHKKPVMLDFIAHRLDVYNNQQLSPFGITHSQAKILVRLAHSKGGRLPQSELKTIGRRGSTITSILANLEKGGFIKRSANESDARAKYIEITDKGREVQQTALKNILELDELLDKQLDEAESKELSRLLQKVIDGIRCDNCINDNKERNDNA